MPLWHDGGVTGTPPADRVKDDRSGRVRSVAEMVPKIGGQAFRRFGFTQSAVIERWPEIVGESYARHSRPESIGFPRGMAYMDFIKTDLEPKGIYKTDQVKLYPSYNEVLTDLQNGQVDLAFLDGTVASVYAKKLPIQDSYVFTGFDRFGFAFPKGSALRADFDKYLDELGPEKKQAIIDKWMK